MEPNGPVVPSSMNAPLAKPLIIIGVLVVLLALIGAASWAFLGKQSGPAFSVYENGERAWYELKGERVVPSSVPDNARTEVAYDPEEGEFSVVSTAGGKLLLLAPEGLVALDRVSGEREVLIARTGLEYGSSAISHTADAVALFNDKTNQIDVFSLDALQAFVSSYEGSVPMPEELYGVGFIAPDTLVVRTGQDSFDIYHVADGSAVKQTAARISSFLGAKTAHAWTYSTTPTATNATTVSGQRCTGTQVASLGTASGSGTMPSVQTTVWSYMPTPGNLPASYNDGSYCIQALTTVTTSGGGGGGGGGGQLQFEHDPFNLLSLFAPVAEAQTTTWTIAYTAHSGTGKTTGTNYYALTYTASAAPTADVSLSPTSIQQGNSSALTWSSTGATSCTGTGFSTGDATSGTVSVSPTANTTYSVSCTGTEGTATDSATLTVSTPQCSDSADNDGDNMVDLDDPGCSSESDTSESNVAPECNAGGEIVGHMIHGPYAYTLEDDHTNEYNCCSGTVVYGGPYTTNTTESYVACYPPEEGTGTVTADLSAAPSTISSDENSTLTWTSSGADYCESSDFATGNATSGTAQVSPDATTAYDLSCYSLADGGSASDSATVTVTIPAQCADGIDNDGDDLIDSADDDCVSDEDDDEGDPENPDVLSCETSDASVDLNEQVTYSATPGMGPYDWNPSGAGATCDNGSGATEHCSYAQTGQYLMSVTAEGQTAQCYPSPVQVGCSASSAEISASPERVASGKSSTISWEADSSCTCSISGPGLSSEEPTGSQAVTVTGQQRYDMTCNGGGSDFVIVNIAPSFIEF